MSKVENIFDGADENHGFMYLQVQVENVLRDVERARQDVLRYAERLVEEAGDHRHALSIVPRNDDPAAEMEAAVAKMRHTLDLVRTVHWAVNDEALKAGTTTNEELTAKFDAWVEALNEEVVAKAEKLNTWMATR